MIQCKVLTCNLSFSFFLMIVFRNFSKQIIIRHALNTSLSKTLSFSPFKLVIDLSDLLQQSYISKTGEFRKNYCTQSVLQVNNRMDTYHPPSTKKKVLSIATKILMASCSYLNNNSSL